MTDLKTLRRRKFLTQKDLGNSVGVSYQTVQNWEAGVALPRLRTIPKLAEALGISTDDLLEILNAKIAAQSLLASCAA
jgi:DNA-binding XRE family transcriptional regulator